MFKFLYEDLKPDRRFSEVALEFLRETPLIRLDTVLACLFEANFDFDSALEVINRFIESFWKKKRKILGTRKDWRFATELGILWKAINLRKAFPGKVEDLEVYDRVVHGNEKHFLKIRNELIKNLEIIQRK